ncbi:MAG: hypothetical protein AB7J13_15180 [Pyrinomonadaceae bacterium]
MGTIVALGEGSGIGVAVGLGVAHGGGSEPFPPGSHGGRVRVGLGDGVGVKDGVVVGAVALRSAPALALEAEMGSSYSPAKSLLTIGVRSGEE